jgi:hypothetical protein
MIDPVIVYLADKRDRHDDCGWDRFDCLCASLKTVKLFLPSLPIVIFHEDFKDSDRELIHSIIPRVTFEQIDFSGQEQYHVNDRPDGRCGAYGYCMMCRFFSGVMQSHPLMDGYTHYMRLDDDNYFVAPVPQKFLRQALSRDYTYAARSNERHESLYQFTKSFMESLSLTMPMYTENVPYNNFHIASLKLWNHPTVRRYLDAIEEVRGCVSLGWPDASIHGMLINCIAPAVGLSVKLDKNVGYRHNQHCVHRGSHTPYCRDGKNDAYPWGPPICLS